MYVNQDECEAAGVDPDEIARIAKGISRYARQLKAMNLEIFGGTGSGSIRTQPSGEEGALILADLDGIFDGGDGAQREGDDGLLRGEY